MTLAVTVYGLMMLGKRTEGAEKWPDQKPLSLQEDGEESSVELEKRGASEKSPLFSSCSTECVPVPYKQCPESAVDTPRKALSP
ncbi:hypothetical protein LX32DRAFT_646844 [Colletotrichum zoysiae]|uniref:Uncharacterized protein n=1 Tax=Colletotrichum zoysiae TaxID=1216348 RepID=A0AAD9H484_9PEZI|nr:hypothetical protein LX32DRAFT_646844 [Colletotrichum zoysiae]